MQNLKRGKRGLASTSTTGKRAPYEKRPDLSSDDIHQKGLTRFHWSSNMEDPIRAVFLEIGNHPARLGILNIVH
jgi:hypothetical protein